MCTIAFPKVTLTVYSSQSSYNYIPFTKWIPAAGVKEVNTLINVLDRTSGNLTTRAAFQTANDIANPDTPWNNYDADNSNAGLLCTGVDDISATTNSKYFVRFGLGVKNSIGGLQTANVEMTVTARD